MNGYRRQILDRDGVRLVTHRRDGPPVIFQHGLCGDAAQPAAVMPEGLGHLVMEARGHGASEPGPISDLSIATFTDDLAAMIDAEAVGPCPVGGISMGAAMALRLAVTRPECVSALILARPAWVTDAAPANMAPNAEVGALIAKHGTAAADRFAESLTARALARDAPDNLVSLNGFFDRKPVDLTAELLTRIAADGPGVTAEEVRAIACPVLLVGTGRDAIHPLTHVAALKALIPHAGVARITAKSDDPAAYQREFRAALSRFFKDDL